MSTPAVATQQWGRAFFWKCSGALRSKDFQRFFGGGFRTGRLSFGGGLTFSFGVVVLRVGAGLVGFLVGFLVVFAPFYGFRVASALSSGRVQWVSSDWRERAFSRENEPIRYWAAVAWFALVGIGLCAVAAFAIFQGRNSN